MIYLFISIPLLIMIFGWAWLVSMNSAVYLEQRKVGIVLWLCFSLAAFAVLKVGGLSINTTTTVIVLASVIGFFSPKLADFVLRRLFKDPAGSLPTLTALIKR